MSRIHLAISRHACQTLILVLCLSKKRPRKNQARSFDKVTQSKIINGLSNKLIYQLIPEGLVVIAAWG